MTGVSIGALLSLMAVAFTSPQVAMGGAVCSFVATLWLSVRL